MKTSIRWWKIVALVILFAGIFLTVLSAQQENQSMRTDLLIKAGIAETGVSVQQVAALTASSADLALPEYQALKNQLRKVQIADPDIRFTYLMGQKQDGTIFLYADSESPESADYSPPGQVYSEATDVLRSVFATGKMAIEGPSSDRWGTWVSGFIPVTDPATGRVIAVFGMDVDASDWNFAIVRACAAIITTVVLILGVIIAFELFQQREQRERRRIEMSEEKFSKAFNTNPALMTVTSVEEGRILDVNASFLRAFGYSREEVIGETTLDLGLYFDPSERTAIIQQIKETGQVQDREIRLYRKNRDVLDGLLTSIIIDIAGTPRMLTVIIDRTDRKRAEDALRQANKQLNLLSFITRHDILNQLMALKGYFYLSKDKIDNPTMLSVYIQKEEQAANTIERQIKFTKDYQELGVSSPKWQNVNVSIKKAVASLPMRDVSVEVDPKNPEIFADQLFEKVFYNLIDNALRYGGTDIKTIRFSSQESGTSLTMVCEDDGMGISADDKKRLFTRGFGKNTGLGLFLSREILAITGITITENGTPDKGARFEITVPKGAYRFTNGGEERADSSGRE